MTANVNQCFLKNNLSLSPIKVPLKLVLKCRKCWRLKIQFPVREDVSEALKELPKYTDFQLFSFPSLFVMVETLKIKNRCGLHGLFGLQNFITQKNITSR